MIKIAFLILHYNTIEDTIKCINSIKKYEEDSEIVIVDNSSPNNSGKELEEKYKNDSKVKVILSEKNLGFAKGNNLGFEYIKQNMDVEFIAMINNDTYLLDYNFSNIVEKEYNRSKFAVMGPKILLPNNKVNPIQKKMITKRQLKNKLIRMKVMYYCNFFGIEILYNYLKKFLFKVIHKDKIGLEKNYSNDVDERQENVVLHGAFLIFSRQYIDKFDGLDDRTFMYMEEKILFNRLQKNNLKSVYNPDLVIFHNEDSSTNSVLKNKRKKNMFIYKNAYNSGKILYKELENENESINKNGTIYVVSHKSFDIDIKNGYKIIGVGKNEIDNCSVRDNMGNDNISYKNSSYCELTAMYWIWKNDNSDFVGITHYRRFFYKSFFSSNPQKYLSISEICKLLNKADIIVPYPFILINQNVYQQYNLHHYSKDLDNCEKIIKKLFPEYIPSYTKVMKRHYLFQFNMLITRKEIYDEYMKWLFKILFELEKITDISNYDSHNKRIYGFLAERLFNVWLEYNKKYKKMKKMVYLNDSKEKNLGPFLTMLREFKLTLMDKKKRR